MRISLRWQLGVYSLLYAGGMTMSKLAQPLYFEQRGALINFSAGYVTMAVVGSLSFVWGLVADRIGGLNAVRIGTLVYAVGITGRLLTDIVPVIIFSSIAAAGACMAGVGILPWIRSRAEGKEIPKIVSADNFAGSLGSLIFKGLATAILALSASQVGGSATVLWSAPAVVILAFIWVSVATRAKPKVVVTETRVLETPLELNSETPEPKLTQAETVSILETARTKTPKELKRAIRRRYTPLAIRLVAIGLLSGFYISMVAPFILLILTRSGGSAGEAALVITVMSLVSTAVSWLLAKRSPKSRPFGLFAVAEGALGLLSILIALTLGLGFIWIAAIFVLRTVFGTLSALCESIVQFSIIPAKAGGFIIGLSQSAFLVGDIIGGGLGGPLFLTLGPEGLLLLGGVGALLNAVLLPLLLRGIKTEPEKV